MDFLLNLPDFFASLQTNDYVLVILVLSFWIIFLFLGSSRTYKAFFGLVIWLFLFFIFNSGLNYLNSSDLWLLNSIRDYLVIHKLGLLIFLFYIIPVISIIFAFNSSLQVNAFEKKIFNKLVSLFLWFFYFIFVLSILISVIENRMIFIIDDILIDHLRNSNFIISIISYFESWILYWYISRYSDIISFVGILLIIYKMILSNLIIFIIIFIRGFMKKIVEKIKEETKKKKEEKKD